MPCTKDKLAMWVFVFCGKIASHSLIGGDVLIEILDITFSIVSRAVA